MFSKIWQLSRLHWEIFSGYFRDFHDFRDYLLTTGRDGIFYILLFIQIYLDVPIQYNVTRVGIGYISSCIKSERFEGFK